jgi:hypothetical protein
MMKFKAQSFSVEGCGRIRKCFYKSPAGSQSKICTVWVRHLIDPNLNLSGKILQKL